MTEKMELLFLTPSLQAGGAERVISRLSEYLAKHHRVGVAAFGTQNPAFAFGGELFDLHSPPAPTTAGKVLQRLRRIRDLALFMRRHQPKRVVAFSPSVALPLLQALPLISHRPHLTVSVRCNPDRHYSRSDRLLSALYFRNADRVVLQTRGIQDRLIRQWRLPPELCEVRANPLDDEFLSPIAGDTPRDTQHLVSCGRLHRDKGFGHLIEAMAQLRAQLDLKLTIYGEGPHRKQLEEQIKTKNLEGRVFLPGRIAKVRPVLDRCTAFVFSSESEGFPNALAEAMARGCPIVAADCDFGPGEMIEHQKSGLLVRPADPPALANALQDLLADPERAQQMGRQARSTAENWAISKIATQWLPGRDEAPRSSKTAPRPNV